MGLEYLDNPANDRIFRAHTARLRKIENYEKRIQNLKQEIEANENQIQKRREILSSTRDIETKIEAMAEAAASGDKVAAAAVAAIAGTAVERLNSIVSANPDAVRFVAMRSLAWPAFISTKRIFTEENKELLALLDLGHGGPFSKREWQLSAPSTKGAFLIWEILITLNVCDTSRPATPARKKALFECGWKAFLDLGQVPEDHPLLGPLGKSHAAKKPKYCKVLRPATRASNMRAAIRRKVWRAFDKLIAVEGQ